MTNFWTLLHVTANIIIIIIIIIIKRGRQCKAETEWYTPYQSEDTASQYQPIDRKKRNGKIVEDYSRDRAAQANKKSIGPALETRQYHTIEYGVSKIVPEGHRDGNKNPAVLRGSATRWRISIPMFDQGTACNPHWHIQPR